MSFKAVEHMPVGLLWSCFIHSSITFVLPFSSSTSASVVEINTMSSFPNICHSQFPQTEPYIMHASRARIQLGLFGYSPP